MGSRYSIIEAGDGFHVVDNSTYFTVLVAETKEEADEFVISNTYMLNKEFDNLVYLH